MIAIFLSLNSHKRNNNNNTSLTSSNNKCKLGFLLNNNGCEVVNEYPNIKNKIYPDISSCMIEFNKSYITDKAIQNPASFYWMNRNDGSGRREYFKDNNYLTLTISPLRKNQCSVDKDCTGPYESCLNQKCQPYSNAEIYNGTCCDKNAINKLNVDPSNPIFNKLSLFRRALLNLVCENETPIPESNCILNWTPTLTIDDPIVQTKQAFKDTVLNTPYLYSDIYQSITCKNLTNGSRGFGFWNTSLDFNQTAIAWFIQLDGKNGVSPNGFFIQIQSPSNDIKEVTPIPPNISPLSNTTLILLPDLDEKNHTYDIIWRDDSIKFIIDGKIVYIETVNIPSVPMAYHNWVDNSLFGYDSSGQLNHILQDDNFNSDKSNIIRNLKIVLN